MYFKGDFCIFLIKGDDFYVVPPETNDVTEPVCRHRIDAAYLIVICVEVSQFNTLTLLFLWMFDLMSLSRDNFLVFLLDISLIFAWKL